MLINKDNIIEKINFNGEACAICIAATDIMASNLIQLDTKSALHIIANYLAMITHDEYDASILQEAIAFQNVYKQQHRIKCATLGINLMKEIILLK